MRGAVLSAQEDFLRLLGNTRFRWLCEAFSATHDFVDCMKPSRQHTISFTAWSLLGNTRFRWPYEAFLATHDFVDCRKPPRQLMISFTVWSRLGNIVCFYNCVEQEDFLIDLPCPFGTSRFWDRLLSLFFYFLFFIFHLWCTDDLFVE